MELAIQFDHVSRHFRDKVAIAELTLSVPAGSVFALLGENSAGKTTSLKMLMGLLQPTSGRVRLLGQDAWAHAAQLRPRLGYVPEKPRFYDWMSVAEIGWFAAGFLPAGSLERYQSWTQRLGLEPSVKLRHLSKGHYSKVALALAMAGDPEVLILDEPTSGLDLLVRREFLGSMVDLAAGGRTVVIASHQISEIERIASHVAFLSAGPRSTTSGNGSSVSPVRGHCRPTWRGWGRSSNGGSATGNGKWCCSIRRPTPWPNWRPGLTWVAWRPHRSPWRRPTPLS
ncbi:MAG TPA: ABC transporter ATP-binding protein [Gemmatales bacterium]|nr:ABC transporter ATP-binding protein [Gemmatales bacterium]